VGGGHGALRVAVERHVAPHRDGARAAGREIGRKPLEPFGAPGGEDERCARAGQLARQRLADTRRRAGDQRDLIVKGGQGDARVIASSAYAEAVLALRIASA
jgi:hypothetical protein